MEEALVVGTKLAGLTESAHTYIGESLSENTRRALASDWKAFTSWCSESGLTALPALPETVILYISDLADSGKKTATIRRHLATISSAHDAAEIENNPCHSKKVAVAMRGIANVLGIAQTHKAAVTVEDLRRMVSSLPDTLIGIRDRALLLVGFAGAFRRSELVALDVEDVEFCSEGMVLTVRRSKTDQQGEGQRKAIHYGRQGLCPVEALRTWLEAGGVESGPVFHSVANRKSTNGRLASDAVADIVKRMAEKAGLNPSLFSGHSLRAGFATEAAKAGCLDRDIMRQTGHKSAAMVQRYIRDGNLFRDNATARVGL